MAFTPLGQKSEVQVEKPKTAGNSIGDFFLGVGQSGLKAVQNVGSMINTGLNQTIGRATDTITGTPFKQTDYSIRPGLTGEEVNKKLESQNTAQQVGNAAGEIAQFFIPASKVSKAETVINTLTQGLPKVLGSLTRIGGKAAVNAAVDTAVATAQTGDIKQGAEIGALGGGIRAGLGVLGESARAFKIPEALYSRIFKNTKRDMEAEFNSEAIMDLFKNRPHVFDDLVNQGIIKVDGGIPTLNTTMAEDALGRGLKGSIPAMGKQVAGDLLQNESQARTLAQNYKGTVGLTEPQFFNVLREISSEFKNVGFGEISKEADMLAQAWLDGKGQVPGMVGLALRRFLDKARMARSFDVPATKLSMGQQNLKTLADEARKRLNQIPGMQVIMDDYSFNIDALEALAQEGKRRGNNQILGLIDAVFLGGGMAMGDVSSAVTLATLRKYIQSGKGTTMIGSSLKNPNASAQTIGAIGGGANLLGGEVQPQSTPQDLQSRKSFVPL